MLGVDWTRGRGTAGFALAHSSGDGDYRSESGGGDVSSTLTGIYPYGRYAVNRWGSGRPGVVKRRRGDE